MKTKNLVPMWLAGMLILVLAAAGCQSTKKRKDRRTVSTAKAVIY